MTTETHKQKKEQLDSVLQQILQLTRSDYSTRIPLSGKADVLDTIYSLLNKMAEELEAKTKIIKNDKNRIEIILDIIVDYSIMDFSKKLDLSEAGDEIDALSAGLNMLAEELQFSLSAQKKYADELQNANVLLIESNEKIHTVLNNTPDAIIATDLKFKIIEWNKAAEEIYGYTKDEVVGKSAEEIISTEHIPPFTREKAREQMVDKGTWSGELRQTTQKGKKMLIHSTNSFLKNKEGFPIGYLGVNRDITESRKMEIDLIESEKRYHFLVNEIKDYAIILLDTNGIIRSWNKGAEKIKGYKEDEIIGKHFSIFYTEEDKINHIPEKALDEAKTEKRHFYQGWRLRKDKSSFWADGTISELVDAGGNLKGFVKITRDLSERKKTEEEIFKKTEELKRSNGELEQFAYVASHDLQEPLRMITSYVQLLEKNYKDRLDKDANDFIHFAVDGANRMQTLIYSLLEYSRINRIQPFEFINLEDTLHEVINDLKVSIKETHAKITWDLLPDIFGDKVLIGQLFFNLIGNAIKFKGNKPPEIFITGKKLNNEYIFSVKDNGIGIKKEYNEKIFIIFQRLHSKEKYPGTGIGLAVCKKIVDRHEGRIWVESQLNKGSTFYFTIKADLKNKING